MYRRGLNRCQKNRRSTTQVHPSRNTQRELRTQECDAKIFITKKWIFLLLLNIFSLEITI